MLFKDSYGRYINIDVPRDLEMQAWQQGQVDGIGAYKGGTDDYEFSDDAFGKDQFWYKD